MQNKTEKFLRHIVMLIQVGFISKRQRRRLHYLYDYIVECLENSQRVACKIRKNTGQPALREYSLACFLLQRVQERKACATFPYRYVCGGCMRWADIGACMRQRTYMEKKILEKSHQHCIYGTFMSYRGVGGYAMSYTLRPIFCVFNFTLLKVT